MMVLYSPQSNNIHHLCGLIIIYNRNITFLKLYHKEDKNKDNKVYLLLNLVTT